MPDIRSLAIYVLLATTILLGVGACAERTMRQAAQFALKTQTKAIEDRAKEADERLKALNASVLAQQKRLDQGYAEGEKNDKTNMGRVGALQRQLRDLRTATYGLLDAADAAGLSRRTEQGRAAASALAGAADGAQGYRVLPATPDQEADDDATEADRINAAYFSCRADAFRVRADQTTKRP